MDEENLWLLSPTGKAVRTDNCAPRHSHLIQRVRDPGNLARERALVQLKTGRQERLQATAEDRVNAFTEKITRAMMNDQNKKTPGREAEGTCC